MTLLSIEASLLCLIVGAVVIRMLVVTVALPVDASFFDLGFDVVLLDSALEPFPDDLSSCAFACYLRSLAALACFLDGICFTVRIMGTSGCWCRWEFGTFSLDRLCLSLLKFIWACCYRGMFILDA